MRTNTLVLAASALATVFAQAPDLATAIQTQENLSTLFGLLGQVSNTTAFLASQDNVTLFAPSDDAFASIVSEGGIFSIEQAAVDIEEQRPVVRGRWWARPARVVAAS